MKKPILNPPTLILVLSMLLALVQGPAARGLSPAQRVDLEQGEKAATALAEPPDPRYAAIGTEPALSTPATNARPASVVQAYAEHVELVGQVGGATTSVTLDGHYAYVGVGPRLIILDVSLPASPVEVGKTSPFPNIVSDVAVAGNYAYVADGEHGLRVVDVSMPSRPVEVGFYSPGSVRRVVVAGDYAYVSVGSELDLRIVDVSAPSSPSEVASHDAGRAVDVDVVGDHAFVADASEENGGLRILDISIPSAPNEVGFYETPGYAGAVDVVGDYAYVGDYTGGVHVVEVSSRDNPEGVGFCPLDYVYDLVVQGAYVYVAGYWSGLRVVDVANADAPTEVGTYETPGWAENVAVVGDYAYVAESCTGIEGLQIIDIADPSNPSKAGGYANAGTPLYSWNLALAEDHVYLSDGFGANLRVVDASSVSNPTGVGFYEMMPYSFPEAIAVEGDYAYVAISGEEPGLWVMDVSAPSSPERAGSHDTTGSPGDVAVAGRYVYLAQGGLRVIDVSIPASPSEVGLWDEGGGRLALSSEHAYVAGNGLWAIDVSTPTSPTEVGFVAGDWVAKDIAVMDDYAYVAAGDDGLRVIDISNPKNPTEIGLCDTPGDAKGVAIAGNYAFIADGCDTDIRVVDVSERSDPVEAGFYSTPGCVYGVEMSGDHAYVANASGGLLVLRYTGDDQYVFLPVVVRNQ